jgi:hypothetical protein
MRPRLLATLLLAAAAFAVTAKAEDAKKPDPPAADEREKAAAKEMLLRDAFEGVLRDLVRLRDRLSASGRAEDKAAVERIDKTLEAARSPMEGQKFTLREKFADAVKRLDDPDAFRAFQKTGAVTDDNSQLNKALLNLDDLLRNGDEFRPRRPMNEANAALLARLKEIRGNHERQIIRVERNEGGPSAPRSDGSEGENDVESLTAKLEDIAEGAHDLQNVAGRVAEWLMGCLDCNREASPPCWRSPAGSSIMRWARVILPARSLPADKAEFTHRGLAPSQA